MTLETAFNASIENTFTSQRQTRRARRDETVDLRKARLLRLREVIVAHIDDIEQALFEDLRKTPTGGKSGEIASVLGDIDTAVAHLADWMAVKPVPSSPYLPNTAAHILYEPRGNVLLLGAWNFPFALVMAPLVPIIAAGNSAIIKPNELTPATSRVVAKLIAEAFNPNDVAVFEGGIEVAERLQELPFDHVFFTGSPAVGKRVMAAAARHLSSVTLELGGKCPAIIGPDVELLQAAAKVVGGRFNNSGQLCLSVDHAWIPRNDAQAFGEKVKAMVAHQFYENGQLQLEKQPRIVNERNFDRVLGYINDALERGARILCGGQSDRETLTIHPTVLVDVPRDARIMQEEIFGPVLPILAYDELDEVLEHIDGNGKPLAMYVFSDDENFVERTLHGSSSGGVTINHVMMHYVEKNLPFGGVNGSGMGRYHGHAGFLELSNARSVLTQGKPSA
ncbi:aldehyde dehydrogenase family protein [Pseudomonas sp. PB120]|uniref:aldehyde dehydrogenase family protein n=1 Tax=Pseudomonas sp. PB120 TaxID=2494700 RepID=UPI0012FD9C55|nr:aldehyde dehydrogenase family protein [Pseudomonas sp. PB120]MVV48834.1 aldehyde dehydrogenase family protein [Pseudomonas sp. PB120]